MKTRSSSSSPTKSIKNTNKTLKNDKNHIIISNENKINNNELHLDIYNTNSYLYKYVTNQKLIDLLASFQRICGIDKHGNVRNYFFHYYFHFASTLGDECFLLIPLMFWISFPIAIPFITNFFVLLLIGQLSKDYFKLPRPKSNTNKENPFTILDTRFETEYGLPSTHTISGLLPFSVLLSLHRHNELSSTSNAWLFCSIYAVSVALSRFYLGVHSVVDVIAGTMIAFLGIYTLHIYGDSLDVLLYQSPIGIYINMSVLVIFLTMYPGLNKPWSASYRTSAQIVGAWLGLGGGTWFLFNYNREICDVLLNASLTSPLYFNQDNNSSMEILLTIWKKNNFSSLSYTITIKRLFISTIIAVFTKEFFKYISEKILLYLLKYSYIIANPIQYKDCFGRDVSVNKYYCIEIPSRLWSYGMLGFVSVVICPYIWTLI